MRNFGGETEFKDFISRITLILVLLIALGIGVLLLRVLARAGSGVLGVAAAVAAGLLVIYWYRELRHTFEPKEPKTRKSDEWEYELYWSEDSGTFVARVPGPGREVVAAADGRKLLVKGGSGFRRVVDLKRDGRVVEYSFKNNVLHVRLAAE